MSSSSATKFQDHYFVLCVDPKADSETIGIAFQELKAKYGPANPDTADAEKYEAIHIAFEVLSDASLRSAFDKLKGVNQNEGNPKFSGESFFEALVRDTDLRIAILCILYDRRRTHPYTPTLSVRSLEGMLAANSDEMMVALWYLKQRSLVINDDKSSLQITVAGLDFLASRRPSAEAIMPLLKPSAIASEPEAGAVPVERAPVAPPAAPPAPVKVHESVLSVLNRALSRA